MHTRAKLGSSSIEVFLTRFCILHTNSNESKDSANSIMRNHSEVTFNRCDADNREFDERPLEVARRSSSCSSYKRIKNAQDSLCIYEPHCNKEKIANCRPGQNQNDECIKENMSPRTSCDYKCDKTNENASQDQSLPESCCNKEKDARKQPPPMCNDRPRCMPDEPPPCNNIGYVQKRSLPSIYSHKPEFPRQPHIVPPNNKDRDCTPSNVRWQRTNDVIYYSRNRDGHGGGPDPFESYQRSKYFYNTHPPEFSPSKPGSANRSRWDYDYSAQESYRNKNIPPVMVGPPSTQASFMDMEACDYNTSMTNNGKFESHQQPQYSFNNLKHAPHPVTSSYRDRDCKKKPRTGDCTQPYSPEFSRQPRQSSISNRCGKNTCPKSITKRCNNTTGHYALNINIDSEPRDENAERCDGREEIPDYESGYVALSAESSVSELDEVEVDSDVDAVITQEDEFDGVGLNVACKLRRMNTYQKMFAEMVIYKILQYGMRHQLQEHTLVTNLSRRLKCRDRDEINMMDLPLMHNPSDRRDSVKLTKTASPPLKINCCNNKIEITKEVLATRNDEFDGIGLNVACKLRRIHPDQRAHAEDIINRTLIYGITEQLQENSSLTNLKTHCYEPSAGPPYNTGNNDFGNDFYNRR